MTEKHEKPITLKEKFRQFLTRVKDLEGEPHYIAMGMSIGIFVSLTPTVPFHTAIAIALAFILKGSKLAAAIGSWVSNPVTIPIFYYACFKTGTLLLGGSVPDDINFKSMHDLFEMGFDVILTMLIGGAVLGIIPALVAYFVTYRFTQKLRERSRRRKRAI